MACVCALTAEEYKDINERRVMKDMLFGARVQYSNI